MYQYIPNRHHSYSNVNQENLELDSYLSKNSNRKVKMPHIYIVDNFKRECDALRPYLSDNDRIEIIEQDFTTFMKQVQDNDISANNITSTNTTTSTNNATTGSNTSVPTTRIAGNLPNTAIAIMADSFGIMQDKSEQELINYYGVKLQEDIKKYIFDYYYSEMPVGNVIIRDIPEKEEKYIYTAYMRRDDDRPDEKTVYQCMRNTILCAINNDIENLIIPYPSRFVYYMSENAIAKEITRVLCQIHEQNIRPHVDTWEKVRYRDGLLK